MSTLREAAEEALRWMEHARLHLTIKERMHPDGLSLYDSAAEALRAALTQPKTELRDQHKAFAKWFLTQNPIAPSPEDMAWAAWKAALAEPKTELRDQHKAFTHWYFGLRGINEANFSPEDLAWAAWKAALAQPETEAQPVAWQSRYIGRGEPFGEWRTIEWSLEECANLTRGAVEHMRAQTDFEVRPLYAHPPRDEWRPASEPPEDGRRVLIWVATESGEETFRPAYCPVGGWTSVFDGETLVAWRDVTPPTEGKP